MTKTLIVGTQENFTNQLYSNLNSKVDSEFDIFSDSEIDKHKYPFCNQIFDSSKIKIPLIKRILLFFKSIIKVETFFEFLLEFKVYGIGVLKTFFSERIKSFVINEEFKKKYKIIHYHYLYKNIIIQRLPKNIKLIVSIWGSDLFRSSNIYNFYYQSKILERADVITIHSVEMREVLLSKFGRHLIDKIRIALFPCYKSLFDKINSINEVKFFKQKYKIENNKIILTIGHNAKKENNHLLIINEIAKIDNKLKQNLICLFPITYSFKENDNYREEIQKTCLTNNIHAIYLTEYLSEIELASLMKSTAILIHLPISDALSGFITEMMYAGCILITGSWLPYGTFRRAGLEYKDIEKIDDLTPLLTKIFNDGIEKHRPNIEKQQLAIERKFFPEQTSKMWIDIYEKLLSV